ncbi:MAG: 30S ribosomal protein S17 [Candidatus Roizmanbacteria bacterium]|nr:MAG: 30S ribosomal protein S17 [Candidatus Roizmanbacteria bacterium]
MSRIFTGTVVSNKMNKTVVVSVERKLRHPFYKKVITRHNKLKAHNEIEGIKEGDVVNIKEIKPISKNKNFIVIKKI